MREGIYSTCIYQVEPFDGFDKSGPADSADYAGTDFLVQGSQGHLPSGRIHTFTYTCTVLFYCFHFRLCLSMSPHVHVVYTSRDVLVITPCLRSVLGGTSPANECRILFSPGAGLVAPRNFLTRSGVGGWTSGYTTHSLAPPLRGVSFPAYTTTKIHSY